MFTFVTFKAEQTRQRIVERALELFAERGYAETTLRDIAQAADVSIGLAYRYFRCKEELVLALYQQLSEEVGLRLDLPAGTIGQRWAALERARFSVLGPHRRTLLALVQGALDPDGAVGVLSPATSDVRALWLRLHQQVVTGATDGPAAPESLARVLYALDLLVVLLWTQDRTAQSRVTRALIDRLARLVDGVVPFLKLPMVAHGLAELDAIFQSLTRKKEKSP